MRGLHKDRELSSPTYHGGGECNDECAEEECDPEICGDEKQGPNKDGPGKICGMETRFGLPCALCISIIVMGVLVLRIQAPMLKEFFKLHYFVDVPLCVLYGGTVLTLIYSGLGDPGQMRHFRSKGVDYAMLEEQGALPKRCHKTWLYKKPIRRYSHYCRWLCNCVGLLNHREYILMCTGIVFVGMVGGVMDVFLFVASLMGKTGEVNPIYLALIVVHFAYCFTLVFLGFPILRIHVGLVARNELASEWKRNDHDVVTRRNGEVVLANDLQHDEFNELFDEFRYDANCNEFDKGYMTANCLDFWCTSRWCAEQDGAY